MPTLPLLPNYYAYSLKVNGIELTDSQKNHFFNCVNKIYKENYRFIYRGDKKDKLQLVYGFDDDDFNDDFANPLFILGAKAGMFAGHELPGINEIGIVAADNRDFRLIFRMVSALLQREFPFGAIRSAVREFRSREEGVKVFFTKPENEQQFVDITQSLSLPQQILVRDYYLALLHHISKSEYYASSFLLSTTSNFSQAYKFAWKGEDANSDRPAILFGWVPKQYEGILSVPDTYVLRRKIDMAALGLPVYEKSFFSNQQEITLKGGLLPHYLLGYLHVHEGNEIFEINPVLFQTNDLWDGIELPIDQSTFHQRIQNTLFGRYFSFDEENNRYRQHNIL